MKKLEKELQEFNHERFNEHYRNLIDVAITSSREDEVLQTLSFLDSLQTFIEKVDETLKNFTHETHCPMCEAKEKTIQLLYKEAEQNKRVIDAQHKAIFGNDNHLTVCEK